MLTDPRLKGYDHVVDSNRRAIDSYLKKHRARNLKDIHQKAITNSDAASDKEDIKLKLIEMGFSVSFDELDEQWTQVDWRNSAPLPQLLISRSESNASETRRLLEVVSSDAAIIQCEYAEWRKTKSCNPALDEAVASGKRSKVDNVFSVITRIYKGVPFDKKALSLHMRGRCSCDQYLLQAHNCVLNPECLDLRSKTVANASLDTLLEESAPPLSFSSFVISAALIITMWDHKIFMCFAAASFLLAGFKFRSIARKRNKRRDALYNTCKEGHTNYYWPRKSPN